MGLFSSKNKCIEMQVDQTLPTKFKLDYIDNHKSGSGSNSYKFKVNKSKRTNNDNLSLKISFQKISFVLSNLDFTNNLKKIFTKRDKYYYDSDYFPLEYGQIKLRYDKNMKLAYVIVDISNNELNLVNF